MELRGRQRGKGRDFPSAASGTRRAGKATPQGAGPPSPDDTGAYSESLEHAAVANSLLGPERGPRGRAADKTY